MTMKRLVENETDGLLALIGEKVMLMCVNYFYYGTLTGVNDKDVALKDVHIVYETGNWKNTSWKDAQNLCVTEWFVKTDAIESYGKVDNG